MPLAGGRDYAVSPYCVVLPALGVVACRVTILSVTPETAYDVWRLLPTAWRDLDHVLTWDTQEGAQLFADMNGGTVKSLSEVFDHTVILAPSDSQPPTE